jgi:hypothetical protein
MLGASLALNARLFVSPKTIGQIPVADDVMEDALIQISLDRTVRVMEFIPSVFKDNALVALDAIAGVRDGDNFVLEVARSSLLGKAATTNFDSLGFRKWSLNRRDILCDSRFRHARSPAQPRRQRSEALIVRRQSSAPPRGNASFLY